MLIKEWMSRPVITIRHDESLNDAAKLFRSRVISMLPVVKDCALIGIITDGDLKRAMPSDATTLDRFELPALLDDIKVRSIMIKTVITIPLDYTVDEAAGIMLKKGISGMPVMDRSGEMIGIITKSDIFRCFVSFTGISSTGQIFATRLQDRPGLIKKFTDMIRAKGGRMCSIMTSYDDIEKGYRKVFFHTFDLSPDAFSSLVETFSEIGQLYYAADLSRGYRKIL
ncbi:MAG: CBS and ACT domain-containing protein [Desulfotignum sp.]|nr:CBS and ACT domain-containing protein [Desulfotignum sp.]